MLKPGDMVGPYEVRGFLGQGGMGHVYKAFDPRLERTVALKVILPGIPGPPGSQDSAENQKSEFASRLLREARAVAALSHPNVVAVYDVGESNDRLYFAMEYVVGTTLRNVESHVDAKDLTVPRKLRWLVDVARALEAAHRVGLIHRDVKPENVMVREDGVVKVLDFGIARRTAAPGDPEVADTVTGSGAIAGTPVYMAPEQIKGAKVDARCDQFGWGVMAYELLVGERPWPDTGDVFSVVARILTDEAPPLRAKVPNLPPVVEETVLRALAKDVGRRFPTMADVADALEPFATQSTGDRARVSSSSTLPSGPRHDASAFAATTRVPTSVSLPPRATPAPAEGAAEPAGSSRYLRLALPLVLLGALAAVAGVAWKNRSPVVPPGVRPLSTVPEAERTYKEGMALWHDGAEGRARLALAKAVELDPTFAAAYLEQAVQLHRDDSALAQAAYQRAFEYRQFLTERDNALLEASEPLVRAKPDVDEWLARLSGKVFQYPRDAELQYLLGRAREQVADDAAAREAFSNAVRLDPKFVPALTGLAQSERNLGHTDEAIKATDRCVAVSPIASQCREERSILFGEIGECRRSLDEAESWRSLDPRSPRAQASVAKALHANGAPLPSVVESLAKSWEFLPTEDRLRIEKADRELLAMYEGDFPRAEQLAREWETALPADADQDDHGRATGSRLNLLLEMGRDVEAAKVAEDFLGRMAAWTVFPYRPDPSMPFYEPLYRTGKLTKAELEAKRVAWLDQERGRLRRMDRADPSADWSAWAHAYGGLAETREEAVLALQKVPAVALPVGSRRPLFLDINLGKAYALAGRPDEALPHLLHVTTTCPPLGLAMPIIRAHYHLGLVYEAKGEPAKAKLAYAKVTTMWAAATQSRTVKLAQARLDALK